MKSLRNIEEEADYYCLVQCDCGRKYKPEEMFLCYYCSKIRCNFCLITEANKFHCKNIICKKDESPIKKTRTSCDKCLECPLCFSPLLTRNFNKKYYLFCTSCYWNSQSIHISKENKNDFENYIKSLHDEKNNGFLRGMYNKILNQLSKDNLFAGEKEKEINDESFKFTNETETVQKAMEKTEQNFEEFDMRIKDEFLLNEKTSGDKYEYNDDYLNNDDINSKKNENFKLKNKLLSCYNDFYLNFNSLSEVKTAFNTNTLSINAMTTLEQRINNPVFQNNMVFNTYPRFIDLIPKREDFYKKCKECGKTIVSIPTKFGNDILLHSYISCLPVIYINKIDWVSNLIKLKFVLVEFNDLIISFKEDKLNQTKIKLPEGQFSVKNEKTLDKKIIIDFKFDENHKNEFIKNRIYIFRFIIRAEFKKDGIGESSFIEYPVEIKFK
jgi:hypothetical protein